MNNQKKICVVGAGSWGKNHIKTLSQLGSLGGVVEKSKDLINRTKIKYPNCVFFSDLSEAIEFGFDGFVIATPPSSHFELAKQVIEAKKHVLVEKPLTLEYSTAKKLNELAKKMDVNLMVGHVLLFHPAFIKIKELIVSGKIGDVQYIYSNRLNLGTFRKDENVFWSFAPHDISLFNYFFGEPPTSVVSNGIDILQENIHDITISSFKYKENKMGHIFVSWLHPFKEHRFVIIGSNGMLRFEDSMVDKPLIFYNKGVEYIDSVPSPRNGEAQNINYENSFPLTNELKYFLSKIDNGKIEIANGDSAVEVIKILEESSIVLKENK
tara:strand:- start:1596 stop:2567 length:972 start_codon:yes stop_codon:yes gene_type:complete